MTILSNTEKQRLEGVRARSLRWQETGITPQPEQPQHDIYFLVLLIDRFLEEGDRA